VFSRDPSTDTFSQENSSNVLGKIADERGWTPGRIETALDRREEVLEYLIEEDITAYEDVARVIQGFIRDRQYILDEVRAGELDPDDIAVMEDDD
jgi:flagellar protein FlaI